MGLRGSRFLSKTHEGALCYYMLIIGCRTLRLYPYYTCNYPLHLCVSSPEVTVVILEKSNKTKTKKHLWVLLV